MQKMKIKGLFLFILMAFTHSLFAQNNSDARLIVKIKKDKSYLFAEATDSTEQVAYQTAKAELDRYIDDYIATSRKADDANYVIVKDIERYTSKVNLARGALYTVFIYVKKNNILKSKGNLELIEIRNESDSLLTVSEPIDVSVNKQDPDGSNLSSLDTEQKHDVIEDSLSGKKYLDRLPEYQRKVIRAVMLAKTKYDVADVLAKNYKLRYVKDFGTYDTCKDITACYWAIETSEGIIVLYPLKEGKMVNIMTGATRYISNGENAVWFRM